MNSDDVRSDADLLRAASNDPEAFGVFYDRHVGSLGAYFLRRTADHGIAAELTAETFAQAFASRRRYRRLSQPAAAWLYTIAVRQINEFHRKQRVSQRYRARLGMVAERGQDDFDRVDDLEELRSRLSALQNALAGLSASSAEAVTLRIGHGWSYRDLADHLHCTPATARVRVSRALSTLESALSEHLPISDPETRLR